jgi:hypothetical protein
MHFMIDPVTEPNGGCRFLGVGYLTTLSVSRLHIVDFTMINECGAVGEEYRSNRRKPASVLLCPSQIPYDLNWNRSRYAVAGSRRLTARTFRRGYCVGLEVLTTVVTKGTIFWDTTPCSPLKVNRRFGGTHRLHLQGRISRERNQRESSWPVGSVPRKRQLTFRRQYASRESCYHHPAFVPSKLTNDYISVWGLWLQMVCTGSHFEKKVPSRGRRICT